MPGRHFVLKTEPSAYSFADLERDGRTIWNGITNALAQQNLRKAAAGDVGFLYHTGGEKAVVATVRIASAPYPDPKSKNPKLVVVDLEPGKRLPKPVPLGAIRTNSKLAGCALIRLPRLSVAPITDAEWGELLRLAGAT